MNETTALKKETTEEKNSSRKVAETVTLVCDGAQCTCNMAGIPAPKKIKAISQLKYTLSKAKRLATTNDNSLLSLNFGSCKVPDPSHPVPCTANIKWVNYYRNIQLPGGAYPLTLNSTGNCIAKGGKITIIDHGQQQNIAMDNQQAICEDEKLSTESDSSSDESSSSSAKKNEDSRDQSKNEKIDKQEEEQLSADGEISVNSALEIRKGGNKLRLLYQRRECRVHEALDIDLEQHFEYTPTEMDKAAVSWYCDTVSGINQYRGSKIRCYFDKEGIYRLQPYLESPGDGLMITVEVHKPRLLFASWRDALGYKKLVTGLKETNHLSLGYAHADNLDVDILIGGLDATGKRISLSNSRQKVRDHHIGIVFTPDREKMKQLKEGMRFFALVKFSNPIYASHQDTVMQPQVLLRLKCEPEIVSVRFLRRGKQVFSARYGETLDGQISARNLAFKELKVEVFRKEKRGNKDFLRKDTCVFSSSTYVNKDGFAFFKFRLEESYRDQYKEAFHTFYVKIKEQSWLGVSAMIMALPEPTKRNKSGAAITEIEQTGKRNKIGQCPNCNSAITIAEINDICSDDKGNLLIQQPEVIQQALPTLQKHREKVGLTRCLRKAHFIAQLAEETRFYHLDESFNYSAASLIQTFSNFKTIAGQAKAYKWGRTKENPGTVSTENQINIANYAYAGINGNNASAAVGDGWRFKGRGFIQLTGKENYKQASEYYNKYFDDERVDWVKNPTFLSEKPGDGMAAALVFWRKNQLNARADIGVSWEVLTFVTKPLNSGLKNMHDRFYFFNRALKTFNVKNCIHYNSRKDQQGSIVVVSGKGHHEINGFIVYETLVWRNLTLESYNQLKKSDELPEPDYITYLSRDAWDISCTDSTTGAKVTVEHSSQRYGSNNEAPPGTYYLFRGTSTQKYKMYLGDSPGLSEINGPNGMRAGIAIHHFTPDDSQGCLTTVSGKSEAPVTILFKEIPDLLFQPESRPVRIILEERKVVASTWRHKVNGTNKWTGVLE